MIYVFSELEMITDPIYLSWLNDASVERKEKILKYKFHKDRLLSACAYRLLCFALKEKRVEFYYNEHKKPMLKNNTQCFNITHCDGLTACIVADSPVGIDAEIIKPYPQKILDHVFTKNEIQQIIHSKKPDEAFFKFWTLKESYIKAIGTGMHFPLKKVEFKVSDDYILCSDKKYTFNSIAIGNHLISSCSKDIQSIVSVGLNELV